MKAGPKAAVESSPLPFRPRSTGAARFAAFCQKFIRVPKGTGALAAAVAALADRSGRLCARRRPAAAHGRLDDAPGAGQVARWSPRWDCTTCSLGEEGAVVCRRGHRRAAGRDRVPHRPPAWSSWTTTSPAAVQMYKDRTGHPGAGTRQFQCLPAEPKRLEGLDYTLAILDEIGVIGRDTYEVVTLAQGKRETSTLIGIGTPGPDPHNNVLADLRALCAGQSRRPVAAWREFSRRRLRGPPRRLRALLGAGQPGAGRLSAPRRHARAAATEDTGGDVPAGEVVPVRPRH